MTDTQAKEILHKLMCKVVVNGWAKIQLGTHETAAIRHLIYQKQK